MKKAFEIAGSLALALLVVGAGGLLWARQKAHATLGRTIDVHSVDFPVPFPLDPGEAARAGLDPEEADSAARAGAIERGRHLVESRYVCVECHGQDFGGGVMVDDPMMGRILGPNIAAGAGGKTASYTAADWDRIVRHGVRPDGRPSAMPAEDFRLMSDRELSDVVAYIRSRPPVDDTVPPVSLGPLGTVLVATGALPLSADLIGEHRAPHRTEPPVTEVSAEFGRHVAAVCTGCHRADLTGGKVPGGDPSWPPAPSLLPVAGALGAWSYADFKAAMRDGVRPDGTRLGPPMDMVTGYTQRMTDTEMEALWTYLRSMGTDTAEG